MSAKFTKGPWFARQMFSGNWDIAAEDGDGKTLARTVEEADAALIASAPDAHTVLREELDALTIWIDAELLPADVREGMCISIHKIETVLFKMEGK